MQDELKDLMKTPQWLETITWLKKRKKYKDFLVKMFSFLYKHIQNGTRKVIIIMYSNPRFPVINMPDTHYDISIDGDHVIFEDVICRKIVLKLHIASVIDFKGNSIHCKSGGHTFKVMFV